MFQNLDLLVKFELLRCRFSSNDYDDVRNLTTLTGESNRLLEPKSRIEISNLTQPYSKFRLKVCFREISNFIFMIRFYFFELFLFIFWFKQIWK